MTERVGVIGGTSLIRRARDLDMERLAVETPYGEPSSPLLIGEWGGRGVVLLVRHGLDHDIPPHRVNHRANVDALRSSGVRKLLLVASAGSLDQALRPPAVLLVEDFLNPFSVTTYHDERVVHITPRLSDRVRGILGQVAVGEGIEVVDGGVYVQTLGPRLETRAEVRVLAEWGHVVGMTMASEATLALERGMEVSAICSVDNMAHGLANETLDFDTIKANAAKNWVNIERLLHAALPLL